MKILYMSVHETLEYDELKLFTELGHECYSLGAYTHPYGDEGRKRPGLPEMPYDPHFTELATRYGKEDLHPEMIEMVDTIIVMHEPSFIEKNWHKMRHKRVIWRSIGQSIGPLEARLARYRADGMQIVRYSPAELRLPDYNGADAIIRFGKDPKEYGGWIGTNGEVVNFTQSMKQRDTHCNLATFQQVATGLPMKLYGPGNEWFGNWGGMVSYEEQKRVLRDSRAYFYTGTHPASYTLNYIEASMVGVPVVAIGPRLGDPHGSGYHQSTYEVHELIENGVNGFWSDDVSQMRGYLQDLLKDENLAREISARGRGRAIDLFGVDKIREQWKEFLERN